MSSNTSEVFQYTGNGQRAPKDVVSVVFHPSVAKAEDRAFLFCKSLRQVVLNEGLETIGGCSFPKCETLERITLPSTVTEIGSNAFNCCSNLKEVVLNDGLETIGGYAFANCRSLESITLPSSVVEIGSMAFRNCFRLSEVVCSERLPEIKSFTFDGCLALERFTFPNISSRLDSIIQAGQVGVQNKIQQYMNRSIIEWRRGSTIYIPMEITRRDGWALVQQHVHQIIKWIKYYEMKEATTLFELALWKARIDLVDDTTPFDRDLCRVEVPGPVKDSILQCLL